MMNWLRLLEIIDMAFGRTGREPKVVDEASNRQMDRMMALRAAGRRL